MNYKSKLWILCFPLLLLRVNAQTPNNNKATANPKPEKIGGLTPSYFIDTKKADSFFTAGKYDSTIKYFKKALEENNNVGKVGHRYKLASAYALTNNKDYAFEQLYKIVEKGGFSNYDLINMDISFVSLYKDERWDSLLKLILIKQNNKLQNTDKMKADN